MYVKRDQCCIRVTSMCVKETNLRVQRTCICMKRDFSTQNHWFLQWLQHRIIWFLWVMSHMSHRMILTSAFLHNVVLKWPVYVINCKKYLCTQMQGIVLKASHLCDRRLFNAILCWPTMCQSDQYFWKRELCLCTERPRSKRRRIWDLCLYITLLLHVKETNICGKESFMCVKREFDLCKKRDSCV